MKERRRRRPSTADILAVWERDRGICRLCGEYVLPGEVSLDHVIPFSQGGASSLDNLQLAHRRCNSAKGNRVPRRARERAAGQLELPMVEPEPCRERIRSACTGLTWTLK
jgi:5-methylcytosine-specific restriction endonuclease McrA